ncbi:hypothetical protein CPAV1605_778 [seawater metagenome]|uniref:Uncharacterized protein n=1 Tax=seawater metagenome TaxID=1561972 RepID=A0A5E8CI36_9ZZZZ
MIQKLTADILYKCMNELKKEENQVKINSNIVKPIISNLSSRLYPYMVILFIMYILILILIISILILILFNKKK